MQRNKTIDYYLDLIEKLDLPAYWKRTQYINLFIIDKQFKTFRSGLFHSYTPLVLKRNRLLMKGISFFSQRKNYAIASNFYELQIQAFSNQKKDQIDLIGKDPMIPQMVLAPLSAYQEINLLDLCDSNLGSPCDLFRLNGKNYTYELLEKRIRAQAILDNMNLNRSEIDIILEIGGSYGLQLEVLMKLLPNCRAINIETPSQAFAAYKYLTKALPNKKIIGSHEVMDGELPQEYDVLILDISKTHLINKLNGEGKISLGINQRSFQEMEWDFTESYLRNFTKLCIPEIFLWEMREGHPAVPHANRSTREKYIKALSKSYIIAKEHLEYSRGGKNYDLYNFKLK